MNERSGLFLSRPFQHSADRGDRAIAIELHALPAGEARTRGASDPTRSSSIPGVSFRIATPYSVGIRLRTKLVSLRNPAVPRP